MAETLSEFYKGKTILLTGATGFLGSYLLEVLLRCLPELACIYILLRPKKGVHPIERRKKIFEKKIFQETYYNNRKLLEKVKVVSGDSTKPNFDMSEEDMRTICEEVTIVIHCAADIGFTHSYRYVSLQNSKGIVYLLDICRRLRKLDVLIYTSSAYANSHIHPEKIEEKVYSLPYSVQTFLDEMENGTDESFAELVSSLDSKCNLKWPNTYTFSKCLAENILHEKASDLPFAIIRPSVIFCAYKGILPGYMEEGFLMSDLSLAVGRGFVRVVNCIESTICDIIPIDIVSNCHIITAWLVATHRCPSMFIVHCTSGDVIKMDIGDLTMEVIQSFRMNPAPRSFLEPDVTFVQSKFLFSVLSFYNHFIPVVALEIYFRLKGIQVRLIKRYHIFNKMLSEGFYFLTTSFDFDATNFHNFSLELQPEEREIFYTDIEGITIQSLFKQIPNGAVFYDWSMDKLSPRERKRRVYRNTMIITFIQRLTVLLTIIGLYIIYQIFLFWF